MNTIQAPTIQTDISYVRKGMETLAEKRRFFLESILPTLTEGQDFFVIDGKRSISKGGSERLAEIYNLSGTFSKDTETLESFGNTSGLIAYICQLKRDGNLIAEGRGSSLLNDHENSANATIKTAQISAFKDAVLRATGTSFLFTQDIENMNLGKKQEDKYPVAEEYNLRQDTISQKQKDLLISLLHQNIYNDKERDQWISSLEDLTKAEASDQIQSFIEVSSDKAKRRWQ